MHGAILDSAGEGPLRILSYALARVKNLEESAMI